MTLSDTKGSLNCDAWPACPDIVGGELAGKESCRTYSTSSTAITQPMAHERMETALGRYAATGGHEISSTMTLAPGLESQHSNTHIYEVGAQASAGTWLLPTKSKPQRLSGREVPAPQAGRESGGRGPERHGDPVHAVAKTGRARPIVEHMAEMSAAAVAMRLGPLHRQKGVVRGADGAVERLPETRPSGLAVVLGLGGI